MGKHLTSRSEDFAKWYNELVIKSGLADHSGVRGCMVIKPYGWAIWEKMQSILDKKFKATGHQNAYFPLLIPKSYFNKEAQHVKGFAKEVAVVTHYRLKHDPKTNEIIVDPDAKLEEELIIRPTSETIIWSTYKNWIQSYRDLPLLINQWANVVRWEMRPRLFLRTTEFFWQEGHTAHATEQEAIEEAKLILGIYTDFLQDYVGISVSTGIKTDSEKFAGAINTYTLESVMQDGKALQLGTSHFLGQNFAKAFDVQYSNKEGKLEYVWATSWGVTTRMIGAMIMSHSDDDGLILPPLLAPIQVVIVPIYKDDETHSRINEKAEQIIKELEALDISVKYDNEDGQSPGWKFAEYELKGVPIRIAIGPKDLENREVEIARRDTKEKKNYPNTDIGNVIKDLLDEIQKKIFNSSKSFQQESTHEVDKFDDFKSLLNDKGGFISAHWDGTAETEEKIKNETKATIRYIPFNGKEEEGTCIYSGKKSKRRVIFAQAY
ncbi:MAG: proline--tRNA ligase [Bacteroidetes bacterium]|nr:proline--tRNA ligase [Bacteroidota bacterium]